MCRAASQWDVGGLVVACCMVGFKTCCEENFHHNIALFLKSQCLEHSVNGPHSFKTCFIENLHHNVAILETVQCLEHSVNGPHC